MKLSPKHVFEEWVSTIFGCLILAFDLIYIGKLIWFTPAIVTMGQIGVTVALGSVGIIFVFVKIDAILRFLPRGADGGSQDSSEK